MLRASPFTFKKNRIKTIRVNSCIRGKNHKVYRHIQLPLYQYQNGGSKATKIFNPESKTTC